MWRALIIGGSLALCAAPAEADGAQLERWPLPGRTTPSSAVRAADGSVWFTTNAGVGRVDVSGRVTRFRVRAGEVVDLTLGPDGALYGTFLNARSVYGDGLVRIGADGGSSLVRYRGRGRGITALAPGPAGDLWAATEVPAAVVRMSTAGAMTTRTRVPERAAPSAMATAPDGTLGFISDAGAGRVSIDGRLTITKLGDFSDATGITATPDGAMWALPF